MVARVCWETAQRWYEVALVRDLMRDWVLKVSLVLMQHLETLCEKIN